MNTSTSHCIKSSTYKKFTKGENRVELINEDAGIEIKYCTDQCYDNANNMSGVYGGSQALIKKHKKLAHSILCSNHSLNLVGSAVVGSCSAANKYFLFLQNLYNFFSPSTKHWLLPEM